MFQNDFDLLIKHFVCGLEPMCNRTWDGWLCWDDTKTGVISEQHCPDYFQDFDPSGKSFSLEVHFATAMFTVTWPIILILILYLIPLIY